MNGLTSKIPAKLRAQNQGRTVTIFALCPFLRPFFGSIPCQALRSLQKSHFASPLSLLGLWLLSLLWSQGVWYQLKPPEPPSPSQEGLHAPGGLYGAPSLGPPDVPGNWMGQVWPRREAGRVEKATVFSVVCGGDIFPLLETALYSWEGASICSGMWSALGWSSMAFCQLPGQCPTLKQCKIQGVLGPGRQTGHPAVLQTALHARPSPQSLGWNLIHLWGQEEKQPSRFSLVKDSQLKCTKTPSATELSHYFLEEEGKVGIRTAFFKLPSNSRQ